MKEKKFRAWDKIKKIMYQNLYGFYEFEEDGYGSGYQKIYRLISAEIDDNFRARDIVLIQHMGLCDAEGNELDWWEKDLFRINGWENQFILVYDNGIPSFVNIDTGYKMSFEEMVEDSNLPKYIATKIGNEFEGRIQ